MFNMFITIKKELRSILRDRKTLITILAFPILIPIMIFLYGYMYDSIGEDINYLIGVNYELNTTELSLLDEAILEAKFYNNKNDLKEAYNNGEIVAYIDYNINDKKYYLYVNEDSEDGMRVSGYVLSYLEGYNQYLAKLYLIGEDIDVDKAYSNIEYEIIDLDGEDFLLILMFSISFTYIVMAIVMATSNMATTATAVEKENGTLETILTFPVKVKELVIGKYLATVIMGMLSSLIGLILTLGSLEIATNYFEAFKDIVFTFDIITVLTSILIVVLASLFIAGLSIAVTSFAKSYKEAQSMCSVLNMLTMIPMFVSLLGIEIQKWYYLIPILNYTQVLMDIFSAKFNVLSILMVIISSILYVVIVLVYILRQYRTEKVLFNIG